MIERPLRARSFAPAISTLARRLGGPRFTVAILLDSLGSGIVMPLSVLFFTIHEGMRPTTVGLGITIGGAASLVLAPLGGHLIDAMRPKRALLCTWLLAAAGSASFVLVHNLLELAIVQSVVNVCSGVGWNAGATLLAGLSDDGDLSQVMATQYSLRNFGFGAGGLLSVLALAAGGIGFDLAVYANAASFLIGAALASGVRSPAARRPPAQEDEARAGERGPTTIWTVLRDRRYVSLAALGGLIAFNQVGLQVILPLWVVLKTHAPRELVGLLFTLNTVLVVTCQLRFSRSVTEVADAPRAYVRATATMAAASAAYLGAHYVGEAAAIVLLTAGTVLLTATEMSASACSFVVSVRLAEAEHRGKYLSVFGMGWGIEGMTGPAVGTALVAAGVLAPWPVIAAIVAVGALGSSFVVRRTPAVRPHAG